MKKYNLVCIVVFFICSSVMHAAVWYVHPDSTMNCIQDCLDSCATGDTVMVGAGTYHESIIWPIAQSILLVSEYGADTTVIDGDSAATVIFFSGAMDSTTTIEGFTIQNGYGLNGGGIMCDNAAPTIRNNIIVNNFGMFGAGITCAWSSANPIIEGNLIAHNRADSTGGGIAVYYDANPLIIGNTLDSNRAHRGGGIYSRDNAPIIEGNVITGNYATGFGGGIYLLQSQAIITSNTIRTNRTLIYEQGAGIYSSTNSAPTIKHCDISDNFRVGLCAYSSHGSIDSCTIAGNEFDGISCSGGANPTIHYCNIYGHNLSYGLRNHSTTVTIDAENNWWGDTSGPGGFGPGTGDRVSDHVDFDPWLNDSVQGIGIEEFGVEAPLFISLQVHPNPFSRMTQIQFTIHDSRYTEEFRNSNFEMRKSTVKVYDAAGKLVKDILLHTTYYILPTVVSWDGTDQSNRQLASGVYFVRVSADDYSETRKVLLVR